MIEQSENIDNEVGSFRIKANTASIEVSVAQPGKETETENEISREKRNPSKKR